MKGGQFSVLILRCRSELFSLLVSHNEKSMKVFDYSFYLDEPKNKKKERKITVKHIFLYISLKQIKTGTLAAFGYTI